MAVHLSMTVSLFSVLSLGIILFLLSWEYLPESFSWATFSGPIRQKLVWSFDGEITFWEKQRNSTPPLPPPATHGAENANSTTANPVTAFKTVQFNTSTRGAQPETPMPILFRKSFKKYPHWDFEEVYNQDAPPRPTTCAQSLRNSKDVNFQKAFLPNIRLFLHKDNINMSEWNRLSHFNNPFGFMQLKYDDVMPSVKLIPRPNEPLLLPKPGGDGCVRCAVVGTGGVLNNSKLGAEIDAHDYVFRVNGAVTKGFEEDVGNRTSVYVHTAHAITASLYTLKKYGYKGAPHDEGIKYVMIPEGMRDWQWLQGLLKGEKVSDGPYRNKQPRTYYSGQYNESRFYVLHQDFLRYVRNSFLRSRNLNATFWAIVRPTNGAFALFLALHTCDVVDAYGFMVEDYKKYSNYYYQRYIRTNVIFYANHDYLLEKKVWKNLHNSKVIRLYQGTGSETGTDAPKHR